MKTVRIYKDNLREHILRSILFTDQVIFLGGGAVIAGLLYLILISTHLFQWGLYISGVIVFEILFIGVLTQQFDNQPLYQLIPRLITYVPSKKKYREKDMPKDISDFQIRDNFIVHKSNLIAVFNIEPYDIALLNDSDREIFFNRMKASLHVLPSKIQIIVRKETATVSDYSKHFFSIYDQSERKREWLIDQYVQDLSKLVNTNKFLIVKYYAVFSVPFTDSKDKDPDLVEATQRLNDIQDRFFGALHAGNIESMQLSREELVEFCKSQLR